MSLSFSYAGSPSRIVFGAGVGNRVGEWIEKLGCGRALVLGTPRRAGEADQLATKLGPLAAGTYTRAAMHTPVDVTEDAVQVASSLRADCLVAVGGGSTIGLAKAIALRTGLPQIVVPTTYSGSEVTDLLGQTEGGRKTTLRNEKVRPAVVLYDPELTLRLPVAVSVTSALNAMAHAAEGLYANDRNPIATLMAGEALRVIHGALPRVVKNPADIDTRSDALYGAYLCGAVLSSVAVSLHHKLCHTLGGSFDLPHAETHAVLLPHTIGFNAEAVPELLAPLAAVVGSPIGGGLRDFTESVGAPTALRDLGLKESDLDHAAAIAVANPYPNPRPFGEAEIRELLQRAWAGDRPPG